MPTTVPPPVVHSIPADDSALSQQEKTRRDICFFLRGHIVGRSLKRGTANLAAVAYNVRERYVRDIWAKHKKSILYPDKFPLNIRRKKGSGRQFIHTPEEIQDMVKKVPLRHRQTFRALSAQIGIPYTTLQRMLKRGHLEKARSAVRPFLTDANKQTRVTYCKSFVNPDKHFQDLMDRVDIGKKWWYLTKVVTSYILVPGEPLPP